MNRLITILGLALLTAAAMMVGCGKKKNNGPPPPAYAYPQGVPQSCMVGQIFHPSYGCLAQAHCPNGQGWVPSIGRCEFGQTQTGNQNGGGFAGNMRFFSALRITARAPFEALMRDFGGFCDMYTWNWGSYDCEHYSGAGYIIMQSFGGAANQLLITLGAGFSQPDSRYRHWGIGAHQTMRFQTLMYPINNNQGFEFRAQGQSGTHGWNAIYDQSFIGYVVNGDFNSPQMNLELYYRGQQFATATLRPY